jgi:YbgC/YbaW family acyl-CoA thioester hydrolase
VTGEAEVLPEEGRPAFETFVRVRFHEVDALGHVNNAAYLNYIEQAAIDHAVCLGLGMEELRRLGGTFVARRHEIDFLRPAFAGDVLRIVTWLGNPRGARIERSYLVTREPGQLRDTVFGGRAIVRQDPPAIASLIARAKTEWVFVGVEGQPRRLPGELLAMFRSPI